MGEMQSREQTLMLQNSMMLHSYDENRDAFLRDILKHVFCCHDILVLN